MQNLHRILVKCKQFVLINVYLDQLEHSNYPTPSKTTCMFQCINFLFLFVCLFVCFCRLDTVQGENAALNVELTERIEELRRLDSEARLHHTSSKQKVCPAISFINPNLPGLFCELKFLGGGGGHYAPPPPQDLDHGWPDQLENRYRYRVTCEEQDGGISSLFYLLFFFT